MMLSQLLPKSWDDKNQLKGSSVKALRVFSEIWTCFSEKHISTFIHIFIKSWGILKI